MLLGGLKAVIGNRLAAGGIRDPDLGDQTISARRGAGGSVQDLALSVVGADVGGLGGFA